MRSGKSIEDARAVPLDIRRCETSRGSLLAANGWLKIKHAEYSQKEGRADLFHRRRT
jgi:hypothetical protein